MDESVFYLRAPSVDAFGSDPSVDPAPVISDLILLAPACFDEVEKLPAVDFAQHDMSCLKLNGIGWLYGTELSRLYLPLHGVAARTKLNGFASLQLCDIRCGPAHVALYVITAHLA